MSIDISVTMFVITLKLSVWITKVVSFTWLPDDNIALLQALKVLPFALLIAFLTSNHKESGTNSQGFGKANNV